jgi:hypothetical protein
MSILFRYHARPRSKQAYIHLLHRSSNGYMGQRTGAPMEEEPGAIFTCEQQSGWSTLWSISCTAWPFPMMSNSPCFSPIQTPSIGAHSGIIEDLCAQMRRLKWDHSLCTRLFWTLWCSVSKLPNIPKISGSFSKSCIHFSLIAAEERCPGKKIETEPVDSWAEATAPIFFSFIGAAWFGFNLLMLLSDAGRHTCDRHLVRTANEHLRSPAAPKFSPHVTTFMEMLWSHNLSHNFLRVS